jgi:hypothetical protein
MKKLTTLLLCLSFSVQSMAGLIVTADASDYTVGDTININLSYQADAPLGGLIDKNFDAQTWFTFTDSTADFASVSLPAQYTADTDPFETVDYDSFSDEWLYSLSTFGTDAPFDTADMLLDLGTLSFVAKDAGDFMFDITSAYLMDVGSFYDDNLFGSQTLKINAVGTQPNDVPEPPMVAILLLGLLAIRKAKKS